MGLFNSYDKEYEELYSYLTEHDGWEMKPRYAKAFLEAYKKPLGKKLRKGRKAASDILNKGPGFESIFGPFSSTMIAFELQDHEVVIVAQAYMAYMADLRRDKHVGTDVEKAIWAILSNGSDLLDSIDSGLHQYIQEIEAEKFPDLYEDVLSVQDD